MSTVHVLPTRELIRVVSHYIFTADDTGSSGSNDDLIDGDLEEGMSTVQVLPTTVCSVSIGTTYSIFG